ncbi:MAG: hypothetical protein JWR38_2767 [Mucilaginibacter sp.]|nr:hypothetical protein [Mucilaginibacter sp.]
MNRNFVYPFTALLVILIFFSLGGYAQTTPKGKWQFVLGAETGLPTGRIKSYSNIELGATVSVQYGLSEHLILTFTSGYYNFFAKKFEIPGFGTVKPDDIGIIPVKAGIKSFLGNNFYVAAEIGAGFETPGGPVKLILSPGIGYATNSWDVGLRYENFTESHLNYGMMTLRLAHGF